MTKKVFFYLKLLFHKEKLSKIVESSTKIKRTMTKMFISMKRVSKYHNKLSQTHFQIRDFF